MPLFLQVYTDTVWWTQLLYMILTLIFEGMSFRFCCGYLKLINKINVCRLPLQRKHLKAEYFMRPVLSVLMTVTSSTSNCSEFHKAAHDPVPTLPDVPSSKWMTSWFPGNEIITGVLRTVLILIKSHFLKRWPQTSHFSHLRSNSSFPIARSWSPELAKFRSRIGDVYQISPLIWCAGLD